MAAVCGLVMAAGSAGADDGKVSGRVSVGGKPLAVGRVIFHLENGQFVGSKVKDGKYTIDRVPTGILTVTAEGDGIPAKYTRDDRSPLRVMVKEGEGMIDFNLL